MRFTHVAALANAFLAVDLGFAFVSYEPLWTTNAMPFPTAPDYLLEYRQSPCSDHEFFLSKGGLLTVSSKSGLPGFVFGYPEDEVYTWADHGTLGMELHPEFPSKPYLFMLVSLENTPPWNDACLNVVNGKSLCKSFARLARFKLDVGVLPNGTCTSMDFTFATSNPYTLFEGFCSTSNTHGIGDIKFRGSNLLLTTGDLSQASGADWGNVTGDVCYSSSFTYPQGRFRSQRLDFLNGKLWEIYNTSLMMTTGQLKYGRDFRFVAIGMRQPYALAVDPISLHVYIGEVGSNIREEINHITPDDFKRTTPINLGWPCIEGTQFLNPTGAGLDKEWIETKCDPKTMNCGFCSNIYPCATSPPGSGGCSPDYRGPAFEYRNVILDPQYPKQCQAVTSSITGLAIFNGSFPQFGETGALFMPHSLIAADYSTGCMWYFKNLPATNTPDFAGGAHLLLTNHFASSLHLGRDGYLYSTLTDPNNLFRHGVRSSNDPPQADLAVSSNATGSFAVCTGTCQVPLRATLRFDASASVAGGASISNFTFVFGDRTPSVTQPSAAPVVDHSYGAASGTMYVSVTATDRNGRTSTVKRAIIVGRRIGISMLPAPGKWKLGDTISYTLNLPAYLDNATIDAAGSVTHCITDTCLGVDNCHIHPYTVDPGYAHTAVGKITPGEHDMPSTLALVFTIKPPGGGDPFDVSFDAHCLQYLATLTVAVTGSTTSYPWPITSGELDPCTSPCLLQPYMAKNAAVLSVNSIQSDYLGNIYKLTGWTATKVGKPPVSIGTINGSSASPVFTEDNMTITANYLPAGQTVPQDSSQPGWAPGPALVAVKGFNKSIELVWELPARQLRAWDWVVVSVQAAGSRDYSATFPANGPSTVSVAVSPFVKATAYKVAVAGYNSATNTRTLFGPYYVVPSQSLSAEASCAFTPYAPYAYDPDLPVTRLAIPGVIQFEYYADGGNGIAYFDWTPDDTGTRGTIPVRVEDVDVSQGRTTVGFGSVVATQKEWLNYPVTVAARGKYTITVTFNVKALVSKTALYYFILDRADCDVASAVGTLTIPANTGVGVKKITVTNVQLPAGDHTIRFCEQSGGYRFDQFEVQDAAATSRPTTMPSPAPTSTRRPTKAPTAPTTPKPSRKPTAQPSAPPTRKPTTLAAASSPTMAPVVTV